jgi:superfamily II DNA or RNA helicase
MTHNSDVIPIVKTGNILLIDSTDPAVIKEVRSTLTYTHRIAHRGRDAANRKAMGLSPIEFKAVPMYSTDREGRVATAFGYWNDVARRLQQLGYSFRSVNHDKERDVYKPDYENLESFDCKFRASQRELLDKITTRLNGCIDCATGYGKSFIVGVLCALYPRASFDIVCKSVAVLRERLHPSLVQMFGDVGMVGGGSNRRGKRITLYSADSMHKSPATSDFLIGDEIHMMATDRLVEGLMRWQNSRNFGLTASMGLRFDNADFMIKGVFGPLIFKYTYEQSVNAGAVVPIEIRWTKVEGPNPIAGVERQDLKMRYGIWENSLRNQLIADDARRYNDDTQVLITCATVEHVLRLKKLLPEYTVVFREQTDKSKIARWRRAGLWSDEMGDLSLANRSKLAKQFEAGTLKKVICNTVWNVGVSFDNLGVLIRADGTGSAINDIQIPGRTSRLGENKEVAIVHDYEDNFDPGFKKRAGGRRNSYEKQKWKQCYVDEMVLNE